jgi:hypothetical protein
MEPTAEASRRAMNATDPAAGRWSFTINRLVAEAGEVASDVSVTHGAVIGRAITLSTVRDGRIGRQVEFWSDQCPPTAWRAAWVSLVDEERQAMDKNRPCLAYTLAVGSTDMRPPSSVF